MRMTTKLVSLLTILFVFFKFGEPAQVMMSIYGDKNFLFHSQNLAEDEIVGFVYDNADGAFAVANCTAADETYFKLKSNCTVLSLVAVTAIDGTTQEDGTLINGTESGFPATDASTNMMIAKIHTIPIVIESTTKLNAASNSLLTITNAIGTTSSVAANVEDSTFLCNALDEATTKTFINANTGTSTFGQVDSVGGTGYPSIMKCVGVVRSDITQADTPATSAAFATFILLITDHANLVDRFSSLAFPSVVLFPQSINQTANATAVGYINVVAACPTGTDFTFGDSSTTSPCKGKISIGSVGNNSFSLLSYNSKKYYLPVVDASGATTCPATSTTTCEDFAFNSKYSSTLIGMLLIFMLKMSQSY